MCSWYQPCSQREQAHIVSAVGAVGDHDLVTAHVDIVVF